MKRILPSLILIVICSFACQSSSNSLLKGTIKNQHVEKVFLFATIGHAYELIDSTSVNERGQFEFQTENFTAGFYQIALNDSDLVDIIINPKDGPIELEFDSIPLQNHIKVIESSENEMLWKYKAVSREAQSKDQLFEIEKYKLPQSDSLGRAEIETMRLKNQGWRKNQLRQITAQNPNSYFSKIIAISDDLGYMRGGAPRVLLNEIPFSDPEFLRTSTYAQGLLTYLGALPMDSEQDFMRGLDMILDETKKNEECRNYTLNYFIDLFGQGGPEIAFQHVISTHVTDADMETLDPELRERVRKIRLLGLGAVAPDVRLPDMRGDSILISDVVSQNEATCLFFYSSSCDHCHDQMPGLKVLYEGLKDSGFDVMGIALDTDTVEFYNCIIRFELPWSSYTEQLGWGSKAANAFEIAATPSFYLLDKDMRIMAKPSSSAALKNVLKQLPPFQNLNEK